MATCLQGSSRRGSALSGWAVDTGVDPVPWIANASLRRWVIQPGIDEGTAEGLTSDERAELARLRRENRTPRSEREILKRATACFAKGTDETR